MTIFEMFPWMLALAVAGFAGGFACDFFSDDYLAMSFVYAFVAAVLMILTLYFSTKLLADRLNKWERIKTISSSEILFVCFLVVFF